MQDPLPVWVAVGGTPAVGRPRRARSGLPMALAIIGGLPERFAPFAELHRRGRRARRATSPRRASASTRTATSPRRSQQAADESFPPCGDDEPDRPGARLAADDPRSSSTRRATLRGANFVGSPQQVVEKILFQHEIFGHDRFLLQFSVGAMPHDK